ncbi:MAG: hypothetical protein ACOCQW_05955 [Halanaerobiaceae bacterium]
MKKISSFFILTKKDLLFFTSIFILGIILGATIITIYTAKQIDTLILKNNDLTTQINEQKNQINQMDERFKNKMVVRKITPVIDSNLNKHTQQSVVKKIRKLLSGLIGQELEMIDPLLLRNIINEASIIVEDHTFHLHLSYLVITDEIKLYLKIDKYGQDNNE